VLDAGVRWFGPYLGGAQVRQAAATLRRIFPLHYAVSQAVGTDRAFADRLGVDPADRDDLASAIAAILDRDAAAVASIRDRLRHERERASAGQRYELARRLHRKLGSIAWVTGPQRLVGDGGARDVPGWAAGVLFTLALRGGRGVE
jgi:excinuclease UvrABC nuclease subunit